MVVWEATKTGLKKALKLSWKICKIIVPVYLLVAILEYSRVLEMISGSLEGVMGVFGLPGESALALLFANSINIYASLPVIEEIALTVREATILAMMISISHSIPVETSVIKGLKVPRYFQIPLRMILAVVVGMVMNAVWR